MYKIKIVTYEGGVGHYESFNARISTTEAEAIAEAKDLVRRTGKCYGVFSTEGKVYDTSPYFARFNLEEWQ